MNNWYQVWVDHLYLDALAMITKVWQVYSNGATFPPFRLFASLFLENRQ